MEANDIALSVDLTSVADPTGSQINQAIIGAEPNTDRGFVLVTRDVEPMIVAPWGTPVVPDPTVEGRFVRYLWIRKPLEAGTPKLYAWDEESECELELCKWKLVPSSELIQDLMEDILTSYFFDNPLVSSEISDGSITLAKMATQAGPSVLGRNSSVEGQIQNIVGTTYTVLGVNAAGTLSFVQIDNNYLSSSFVINPTTAFADNTISGTKLTDLTVTGAKIADGTITNAKVLDGSLTSAKLTASGVTAGTYVNPTIQVDSAGRVVSATSAASSSFTHDFVFPAAIGGTDTVAHGLGAVPSRLEVNWVCIVDNGPYVVGDILTENMFFGNLFTPLHSVSADLTNINIAHRNRSEASNIVLDYSNGTAPASVGTIGLAKFKFRVTAFK